MKIICIGPPKTGTVTLSHAFRKAGLNARHGRPYPDTSHSATLLWRAFLEGRDPFYYLPRGIDCIADPYITSVDSGLCLWPCFSPMFLAAVRRYNPDTWILLNTRRTMSWIESVSRWKDLRKRIAQADLPYLQSGLGSRDEELVQWVKGFYHRTEEQFRGDPRFLKVEIENPETPRIIEQAIGIKLPWWGMKNVNEKQG